MGHRLIISESEKKKILEKYSLNEQESNLSNRVYGMIKNFPLVKKIEQSYDPDLKKHIANLVKLSPKLKPFEIEMNQKASTDKSSTNDLANKIIGKVDEIQKSQINEQPTAAVLIIPTVIFLLLFLRQVIYNKKNPGVNQKPKLGQPDGGNITFKDPFSKEINDQLQQFVGKTINLYDDIQETDLGATAKILSINLFTPTWLSGDIQSIDLGLKVITKGVTYASGVSHKVYCQYNPDKLEDRVTTKKRIDGVSIGQSVGGGMSYEYNKKFTDALNQIAGKWCKKPEADFGLINKTNSSKIA
jgi:hypothetical protein